MNKKVLLLLVIALIAVVSLSVIAVFSIDFVDIAFAEGTDTVSEAPVQNTVEDAPAQHQPNTTDMFFTTLKVALFGMLAIFIVMILILCVVKLLNYLTDPERKNKKIENQ